MKKMRVKLATGSLWKGTRNYKYGKPFVVRDKKKIDLYLMLSRQSRFVVVGDINET